MVPCSLWFMPWASLLIRRVWLESHFQCLLHHSVSQLSNCTHDSMSSSAPVEALLWELHLFNGWTLQYTDGPSCKLCEERSSEYESHSIHATANASVQHIGKKSAMMHAAFHQLKENCFHWDTEKVKNRKYVEEALCVNTAAPVSSYSQTGWKM